jgi:nucleoside-diphosphate-sugar epimerase
VKILLTGSTGYIAQRLLPILLNNGNEVICCVRDRARFNSEKYRSPSLSVLEVDFLKNETLQSSPIEIDAA